jgi:hypothetical protein
VCLKVIPCHVTENNSLRYAKHSETLVAQSSSLKRETSSVSKVCYRSMTFDGVTSRKAVTFFMLQVWRLWLFFYHSSVKERLYDEIGVRVVCDKQKMVFAINIKWFLIQGGSNMTGTDCV